MSGLMPYRRVLTTGETQNITARGSTFIYRESNDATAELEVTLGQTGVGDKTGRKYTLTMRRGEKWFAGEEFDQISVRNTAAVTATVDLLIGYGDYVRPPPAAPDVPISYDFTGGHTIMSVLDTAGWMSLGDFIGYGRRTTFQNRSDSAYPVYLSGATGISQGSRTELVAGGGGAERAMGFQLMPGQAFTFDGAALLYWQVDPADAAADPNAVISVTFLYEAIV